MKRTTINEFGEKVVVMDGIDRGALTEEEKEMIRKLDTFEDEYDEDCPPMPETMMMQMRKDILAKRKARESDGSNHQGATSERIGATA